MVFATEKVAVDVARTLVSWRCITGAALKEGREVLHLPVVRAAAETLVQL